MAAEAGSFMKLRWLWFGLAILVVASPLGLLAPGTAWGEWGAEELANLGFQSIPAGLERLSGIWGAPIAGYDLPALGNANLGYILSAVLGIIVTALVVWLFTMLLTSRSRSQAQQ
jgi:cobalt/nickel transport system permease protein